MTDSVLKEAADIIGNLVIAVAAVVGGIWAIWRYRRERSLEAALEFGIDYHTSPCGDDYLVTLDVVLTNKGRTKIQAKPVRPQDVAYFDGCEQLISSCSLQLRRVNDWNANFNRYVDWFESPALQQPQPGTFN